MLLLTLRGTPTLYYGDELGMHDVPIPPERVQDPCEKSVPGLGARARSRAHADAVERRPHAGFTTGEPWLPLAADCRRGQRRGAAGRARLDAGALPRADRAAPRASRRSRSATMPRSRPRARCWPTAAGRTGGSCWSRSTSAAARDAAAAGGARSRRGGADHQARCRAGRPRATGSSCAPTRA